MKQTAAQLLKEYNSKAWRCYEVYEALEDSFANSEEVELLVNDIKKYQALSELMTVVVRRSDAEYPWY